MKRILIMSHAMEMGGAERALLGLLEHLDYDNYKVDLFLMRHKGAWMEYIPKQVNLLPQSEAYNCLAVPMVSVLRKGNIVILAGRLVGKLKAARYVKKHRLPADNGVAVEYSHKYTKRFMPAIQPNVEYDLAISFLTPHYFVAEKVKARRRIAWIHTDYSFVAVNKVSECAMWGRFDHIISISEKVSEAFVSVFPSLEDRLTLIENVQPEKLIRTQAEALSVEGEMEKGSTRLLSIGRFCTAKNFDNVPTICKILVEMGLNVKWYLIGYGGDERLIRQKIAQAGMEDRVVMLGKKENPYPYLRACDLYVQPSRYEGKCVTVREAQLLGKPVVITRYATSASQLEDGVDGVIVPMDNQGCAEGIANLLRQPERMRQLAECCAERDYSNTHEVAKLYRLIEGMG